MIRDEKRKRIITGWRQVPRPGPASKPRSLPVPPPKAPLKIPLA